MLKILDNLKNLAVNQAEDRCWRWQAGEGGHRLNLQKMLGKLF